MRGSVPISIASATCVADLEACLDVGPLMKNEWAERRLGDLNLWISTSGSQAKGRASFDHRLASKPEIRAIVSNLLLMLSITIQKCKEIAVAPSETRPSSAASRNDNDADAVFDTSSDGYEVEQFEFSDESSSSFDGDHNDAVDSDDDALHHQMRDVEDIVRQLSQITSAVRRSGRGFRLRKADQLFRPERYEELRVHLKTMILQNNLQRWSSAGNASDLIEGQKSTETSQGTWSAAIESHRLTEVQGRLIMCNLMRRHRFIYQQRHSKKMEPSLSDAVDAQVIPPMEQEQQQQPDTVKPEPAVDVELPAGPKKSSVVKPTMTSSVVTGRTDKTGTTATGLSTSFSLQTAELKKAPATPTVISMTVASRDVNYPWPPGDRNEGGQGSSSSDGGDDADDSVADEMAPPSLKQKLRLLEQAEDSSTLSKEKDGENRGTDVERLRRKGDEKMEGNINFKCPCCCQALDSDLKLRVNNHRWRAHIADDLMPYTCIIPACEKPETMYPTKELWRQHLFKDHQSYVYWRCLACAERLEFLDEGTFRTHLQEEHVSTVPSNNIGQLLSAWRKSAPTEIKTCPMCDFPNDQEGEVDKGALLDHIAIELQNFALRALPWADDNGQESSIRIGSSTEKVSVWMDDMLEEAVASGDFPSHLLNKDWSDDGRWKIASKPPLEPMEYLSDHFSPGKNDYFGDEPARSSVSKKTGASSTKAQLEMLKEEEGSTQLGVESSMHSVPLPTAQRPEVKTRHDSDDVYMDFDAADGASNGAQMSSDSEPAKERLKQLREEQRDIDSDIYSDFGQRADRSSSRSPTPNIESRSMIEMLGVKGEKHSANPDFEQDVNRHSSGSPTPSTNARSMIEKLGIQDERQSTNTDPDFDFGQGASRPSSTSVQFSSEESGMETEPEDMPAAASRLIPRDSLELNRPSDPDNYDALCRGVEKEGAKFVKRWKGDLDHALLTAARRGHSNVMRALLSNCVRANTTDSGFGDALQVVSSRGDANAVKDLLDHGADPNIQGGRYGTAIQAASSGGHMSVVQMLIKHGAAINAPVGGRYGTALQAATSVGKAEIVEMLLNHGTDPNATDSGLHGTALKAACFTGDVRMVRLLLDAGAEINAESNTIGRHRTALHVASAKGHIDVVNTLLERGAVVDYTAIMTARAYNHGEIEKILRASARAHAPTQDAKDPGRLDPDSIMNVSEDEQSDMVDDDVTDEDELDTPDRRLFRDLQGTQKGPKKVKDKRSRARRRGRSSEAQSRGGSHGARKAASTTGQGISRTASG